MRVIYTNTISIKQLNFKHKMLRKTDYGSEIG